jgi:hypothetical protein
MAYFAEYHSGICLEGVRKYMKNLSENSWSAGQDLFLVPPRHGAGVPPVQNMVDEDMDWLLY